MVLRGGEQGHRGALEITTRPPPARTCARTAGARASWRLEITNGRGSRWLRHRLGKQGHRGALEITKSGGAGQHPDRRGGKGIVAPWRSRHAARRTRTGPGHAGARASWRLEITNGGSRWLRHRLGKQGRRGALEITSRGARPTRHQGRTGSKGVVAPWRSRVGRVHDGAVRLDGSKGIVAPWRSRAEGRRPLRWRRQSTNGVTIVRCRNRSPCGSVVERERKRSCVASRSWFWAVS